MLIRSDTKMHNDEALNMCCLSSCWFGASSPMKCPLPSTSTYVSAQMHISHVLSPDPFAPVLHNPLLHDHNSPERLHSCHDLLTVILRHPFLHLLRRALHKLLTIHQT